jgi:hypothetical protein
MARKGIRIALLAAMVALCILIVINLIAASPSGSGSNEAKDIFIWTKAICNEKNYCLDVQITCINSQVVDIKPQSEGIYFSGNWRDPRPEDAKSELC